MGMVLDSHNVSDYVSELTIIVNVKIYTYCVTRKEQHTIKDICCTIDTFALQKCAPINVQRITMNISEAIMVHCERCAIVWPKKLKTGPFVILEYFSNR